MLQKHTCKNINVVVRKDKFRFTFNLHVKVSDIIIRLTTNHNCKKVIRSFNLCSNLHDFLLLRQFVNNHKTYWMYATSIIWYTVVYICPYRVYSEELMIHFFICNMVISLSAVYGMLTSTATCFLLWRLWMFDSGEFTGRICKGCKSTSVYTRTAHTLYNTDFFTTLHILANNILFLHCFQYRGDTSIMHLKWH